MYAQIKHEHTEPAVTRAKHHTNFLLCTSIPFISTFVPVPQRSTMFQYVILTQFDHLRYFS